jgi:hypothetical protein
MEADMMVSRLLEVRGRLQEVRGRAGFRDFLPRFHSTSQTGNQ